MSDNRTITVDLATAYEQLKNDKELADAINKLVAPTVAESMKRDAKAIEKLYAKNMALHAEVSRLKLREQDLLEANNRYLERARRAEDLYRAEPSAITDAAIAAYEFDCRHGDDRPMWSDEIDLTQGYWKGVVHAVLSGMVKK